MDEGQELNYFALKVLCVVLILLILAYSFGQKFKQFEERIAFTSADSKAYEADIRVLGEQLGVIRGLVGEQKDDFSVEVESINEQLKVMQEAMSALGKKSAEHQHIIYVKGKDGKTYPIQTRLEPVPPLSK